MSIFDSSLSNIADLLTAATGFPTSVNHFTLGSPVPISDGDENTEILVTMLPDATYFGSKLFQYSRLDLSDLSHYTLAPIGGIEGMDLKTELFNELIAVTGIQFDPSEFEDSKVIEVGGELLLPLIALPSSVGWLGSFNYPVKLMTDLSAAFTTNVLPSF